VSFPRQRTTSDGHIHGAKGYAQNSVEVATSDAALYLCRPETGQQVPLIDTPAGLLGKGSVVEPNVSEDGTRVIFSYFHDATFTVPSNQGSLSKRGADLYVMDMTALLADPTVDPATLPVRRLTFKTDTLVPGVVRSAPRLLLHRHGDRHRMLRQA
jgi:hypothetical protein